MLEQRQWCEDIETLLGYDARPEPHSRCRRCGRVYRWSGFVSIKIGPCIAERWPCLESSAGD
jgi:hypothetical protein